MKFCGRTYYGLALLFRAAAEKTRRGIVFFSAVRLAAGERMLNG
jgi:hypothetical protein